MPKDFDLSDLEMSGASGMDALFEREPELVAAPKVARRKVASLGDLSDFVRVSSETLVHRSQRELWALKQEGGSYFIERLFDDNGEPLKG